MKTRLMVVDDNKGMVGLLQEYFKEHKDIEVAFVAYDGDEALNLIINQDGNYDIILLDLVMPKKDGMALLEELKVRKINKNIIVLTSYNEQETIRTVSEYGVKYFVLKPFEFSDLEKKIKEITKRKESNKNILDLYDNNISKMVTNILHSLGIPSHIKGYGYIRESITAVYENPSLIGGITKELYPMIAKRFDTSASRVERAIRHAIEVSWNRGDWDLMEEIFGHSVDIDRAKPTNSEFIVTIADKLRLEMLKV